MTSTRSALDADWLAACRRAVVGLADVLAARPTTAERARGDRLARQRRRPHARHRCVRRVASCSRSSIGCSADGHRFTALSEERGEIDYGDPSVRVIIDPIDGSLNAKRGLPHHALSIAVAAGDTMADVVFGFVHDFGPARSGGRAAAGAPTSTGPASTPPSASAAAATAGSRCSASSPPTRAG